MNILGQEYQNLMDETRVKGSYTDKLDVTSLARGCYFIQMQVNGSGKKQIHNLRLFVVK